MHGARARRTRAAHMSFNSDPYARDARGDSGRAQRSLQGAEEELATHRSVAAREE